MFRTEQAPSLKSVLIASGVILSLAMGVRHGFGFWLQPVSQQHGWTRETFSLAMALQNLMWGVFGPFSGMAADRFGAARVVFFGALLSAIMSTASGTLLAPSTVFTENLLRPLLPQQTGCVLEWSEEEVGWLRGSQLHAHPAGQLQIRPQAPGSLAGLHPQGLPLVAEGRAGDGARAVVFGVLVIGLSPLQLHLLEAGQHVAPRALQRMVTPHHADAHIFFRNGAVVAAVGGDRGPELAALEEAGGADGAAAGLGPNERAAYSRACANQ